MSTTTPNLGLTKPATNESADITVINGDLDLIDSAVAGKASASALPLVFTSRAASSWTTSSTYADYGYRCAIALTGVTASDVAEVIYGVTEATSGNYAPICETYAGGVYIYSKVNTSITIPTIVVIRA